MPLHEDHKADIELAIYMTAIPDEFTFKTVGDLAKAIRGESNKISDFSGLFDNPYLLDVIRIEKSPTIEPTYGEARECIIYYLDNIISTAAKSLNKEPDELGWNKKDLLIATRQRADNETNLITGEKNRVDPIQRILRECSIGSANNWTSREKQRNNCSSGCAIQ